MPHLPTETAPLASGGHLPLLGFGTWQLRGTEATDAAASALEAGYRHLDTATIYGNQAQVGQALRDSDLPRDEVFLTTKCPPQNTGRELETLHESLTALGTEYVDLWLIHWPPQAGWVVPMWESFVEARRQGLARSIGVSNAKIALIDELTSTVGAVPEVNQIEWSPLLFDAGLLAEHRERGVVLEGYSGLRGGVLEDPVVARAAEAHDRTPAQVVVRWHLQHGVVVIPKSAHAERIRSNADVGDLVLSDEEMAALDALGHRG